MEGVMGKLLTDDQVGHYLEKGFVSPVSVLTKEEVRDCISEIEAFEAKTGKPIDFPHKSRCHQLFAWADRLVHHPRILDAVEDIIGPDILCYHATLWVKPPHSNSFVRWHQDGTYFFLEPAVQVTAWVALTVADEEAGCMQVIPGSHRNSFVEHNDDADPDNLIPRGQGIACEVDTENATSMPLQAGEMSIHHTRLFHASFNNRRDIRRIGLGISYIPTSVRDVGEAKAHALLVRGKDEFNHFLEEKRLQEAGSASQFDYHLALMKRFRQRQDEGASFSKASLD